MIKYALLSNPGHNRVYFENSKKMAIAELTLFLNKNDIEKSNIQGEVLSGIYYITFETAEKLTTENIEKLSRLSFIYGIFMLSEIDGNLYFSPITKANYEFINPYLSIILKYTGKTNELFTKMMINLALFSIKYKETEKIKLLDPIAGKGTTLYEGLIFGMDTYGIEIAEKSVNESYNYIKKFLETEKYKHTTNSLKISGENKSFKANKVSIDIAKNKDSLKEKNTCHWEMISANSALANKLYKKNTFDIIVGDLPYGVQHGNVSNGNQNSSITRNPKELLNMCLPAWFDVLKIGGAIALSWNSFLLSYDDFAYILNKNGFQTLSTEIYKSFEHRVDQSIKRDIIIAIKK